MAVRRSTIALMLFGWPTLGCQLGGYSASINSDTNTPQLGVRFEPPEGSKVAADGRRNRPAAAREGIRTAEHEADLGAPGKAQLTSGDDADLDPPLPDLSADELNFESEDTAAESRVQPRGRRPSAQAERPRVRTIPLSEFEDEAPPPRQPHRDADAE